MQVILDSSFARPGAAPIWGGKNGEFRVWTITDHVSLIQIRFSTAAVLFLGSPKNSLPVLVVKSV